MVFPSTSAPTATGFATSVTSMAVSLPASISAGDLLLAFVEVRNAGTWLPPTTTATYYFDGHIDTAFPGVTNSTNMTDGDEGTDATLSSESDLVGLTGTTAPTSGPTIRSVRGRLHNGTSWEAYTTITAPSGGFTWTYLNAALTVMLFYDTDNITGAFMDDELDFDPYDPFSYTSGLDVSRIEIEVTMDNWTPFLSQTGGSSVGKIDGFYKIADGTEGATATWTASTGTTAVWQVYKVTSWHGTTPPEAVTASGDVSSANPPSLTPSWGASDILWIVFAGHAAASAAAFTAAPTNYSNFVNSGASSGGSATSLASATRQLNASSEDPSTFTAGGSNRWWASATIGIRPAADGAVQPKNLALLGVG